MPSIGRVIRQEDGSYRGYLATLSIRKNISLVPNEKKNENQPDFIVMAGDIEVGAGGNKTGQASGNDYVSLSLSAPEFGVRTIYANLGRSADTNDEDDFAIIWNPIS